MKYCEIYFDTRKSIIPFNTKEDCTSPGCTLADKNTHFLPLTFLHLSLENLKWSSGFISGNSLSIFSSLSFSDTPFNPVIVINSTFLYSNDNPRSSLWKYIFSLYWLFICWCILSKYSVVSEYEKGYVNAMYIIDLSSFS